MKKFLSILGVSILSLSMLVGCGGATAEDIEKAGEQLAASSNAIMQNKDKLDADSVKEISSLQNDALELQKLATDKDADLDNVLKKTTELDKKFRDIAAKNNIEIK